MANRTLPMDDALHAYLLEVAVQEPPLLARLREETQAATEVPNMQIGPEQGAFMAWLVRLLGARRCLEIGTFTGYSALATALALPEDGLLVTCDVSEESTAIARRYWTEAGVADRIQLHLRPAEHTLDELIAGGQAGTYDFAFIDADKTHYDVYYEACLTLLRPGGVIAIDNVLWGGAVAKADKQDESTQAIRALNAKVGRDPRVDATLVPIGDGLFLVRKG
ncbi:MAG: O-methyltransferase [Sandaracinaceae bacterium]